MELLVGRAGERATVLDALADARSGRGRLVLLTGPAGIGKTALAEELAREAAAAGFDVLWGSGWEAGGAPAYRPWTQILRELVRLRGPDVLVPGSPRVAGLVPDLLGAAAPVSATDGALFALFDAVGAVLRAAAGDRPLCVVVDDLHVAGGPSAQLLSFVATELRRAPVLLLATRRPGAPAGPDAAATVLTLGGLGRGDVDELVAATTGAPPDPAVGDRILERTDGNPLFVTEVARLIAAGTTDAAAWPIPVGIRQAIRARLDGLDPAAVGVLEPAAVVGRTFDLSLLARTTGLQLVEVAGRLEPALAADLVADDGPGRFRFTHDLVRETLDGDLTPRDRAALHARVLALLGGRDDADPAAHLALLAHHALAAVPAVDGATAAEHARRAADQAMRTFAFEQAADLYGAALDALALAPAVDPVRRCALLLDRAEALAKGGDPPAARALVTSAAELARRGGDLPALARAALLATERLDFNDIDTDGLALLTEAIAATRAGGADHARLLARLAVAGYHAEPDARAARADAAIAAARDSGDEHALAQALSAGLYVRWGQLPPADVVAVADEIIALAGRVEDREQAIDGHSWRLIARLERGEIDPAERDSHVIARLADELRQPLYRLVALSRRGTLALLRGSTDDALALARQARAVGARGREPDTDAVYWGQVFAIGQFAEVPADDAAEMERIVRGLVAASPMSAPHAAGLVLHCLRTGRETEARGRYTALVRDVLPDLPHDMLRTWTLTVLALACAQLRDEGGAATLHAELAPLAGRFAVGAGGVTCSGAVDHYLGILDLCRGRPDDAAAHLRTAAQLHTRAGAPLLLDMTRRAQAGLAGAEHPRPGVPAPRIRRDAGVWAVTWDGRTAHVPDVKGMRYLADLVAIPGREIRAVDLLRAHSVGAATERDDPGADVHDDAGTPAEPILDARARAAYRARLAELRAERDEADRWHDPERLAGIDAEIDFVARELGAALGLAGRPRTMPTDAERARVSVTRAIRSAIGRITAADAGIGAHLGTAVATGHHCRYAIRA